MQICRLLLNARACILFFSMLCLASDVWSFGVYAQVCWGVVSPLDTVDRKVIDEQEIRGFFGVVLFVSFIIGLSLWVYFLNGQFVA